MERRPRAEAEWAPRPGVPRPFNENTAPVSLAHHRRHVARAVGVWGSLALALEQVRAQTEERALAGQEERARAASRALAQEQALDRLEARFGALEARLGALEARLGAPAPGASGPPGGI